MPTAQSRHLLTYNYNANDSSLMIQFTNGAVYQYSGVPITEYHNLDHSGSKGTYFWAKIRDRYPTTLISGGVSTAKSRGGAPRRGY
jgi:hypothetical protein